ncbi:hypothetical protein ACVWZM_008701 [Bradyrhizobium sp. USDA 4501]
MDLITSSLLNDFTKEFQLDDLPESERFEHFTAYVTIRRHYSEIFDTSDVAVGSGNDLGIDAIAIIVNGVLITDTDAFNDLIGGNPDYLDVSFIFVQAERSPSFDASKLGNFAYGVTEFFNPDTKEPRNDQVLAAVNLMQAIFSKSAKFKRGNPTCRLYYATTGKWSGDGALEARRTAVEGDLDSLDYFPQTNAIRAFAAMFLNEPHNTVRSYKALAERVGKDIFVQGHKLLPYYTAAYTLYLLEYLFRNQKLDSSYKIARYQILLAYRILANKNGVPALNSRHVETYCKDICDTLWAGGTTSTKIMFSAVEAVKAVAGKHFDRDPIHTAAFTESLIEYCKKHA